MSHRIAALEGYMKANRPLPREGAGHSGPDRVVLPSLMTGKLAVYETMRSRGWSRVRLVWELGMPETPFAGRLIFITVLT